MVPTECAFTVYTAFSYRPTTPGPSRVSNLQPSFAVLHGTKVNSTIWLAGELFWEALSQTLPVGIPSRQAFEQVTTILNHLMPDRYQKLICSSLLRVRCCTSMGHLKPITSISERYLLDVCMNQRLFRYSNLIYVVHSTKGKEAWVSVIFCSRVKNALDTGTGGYEASTRRWWQMAFQFRCLKKAKEDLWKSGSEYS